MKSDAVYINQILEAITKIENFVNGLNQKSFCEDAKTQSAVIMQLTLVGEISKKISSALKERVDLPWKEIAGFRDRAIHDYFEIDLDVVWNTTLTDLPELKRALSIHAAS